jgi:CRISPR/Cas system-associated exonuclease Cas4 (RecB family)
LRKFILCLEKLHLYLIDLNNRLFSDGIEKFVQYDKAGVKSQGTIDRIEEDCNNGYLQIVDFKTSGKNASQWTDYVYQMSLYQFMLQNELPTKTIMDKAKVILLNTSENSVKPVNLFSKDELVEKLSVALANVKSYSKLTTNDQKKTCTYCDYKQICPVRAERGSIYD